MASQALAAFARHARRMAESTPDTRVKFGDSSLAVRVGDISDAERDLWRRLAEEAEAYIAGDVPDDVPLPLAL